LPSLGSTDLWLAKPKEGLSTSLVYQHFRPQAFEQRNPQEYLEQALQGNLLPFNDLEHSAFELMPSLKNLKKTLYAKGFSNVTMTGSGTAMMCFGNVADPVLEGTTFYPVSFLNRKESYWYCTPSEDRMTECRKSS
jgi:4-diphosphocytidyl-2-C-methyl-D-erythritol kinase